MQPEQQSMIAGAGGPGADVGCPFGADGNVERGTAKLAYYHDYLQLDKILGAQKVCGNFFFLSFFLTLLCSL